MVKIRERFAELLERKRWNQSDLARELGEHRNWVNYRLTGRVDIKADELPRIAAALGVSPCAFFEEVQPAPAVPELSPATLHAIGAELRRVLHDEMSVTEHKERTEGQAPERPSTIGPLPDTQGKSTLELFMAGWAREYAQGPEVRAAIELLAELSRGLKEAAEQEADVPKPS